MQPLQALNYGYVMPVNLPFDQAVERLEQGLKQEGFGVLCRIDIQAKLKEKLGVDCPRYIILGACNPPIAHQALQQEFNLGLLLPCNTVVYEREGRTYAGVVDAAKMLSIGRSSAILPWSRWHRASMRSSAAPLTALPPNRAADFDGRLE